MRTQISSPGKRSGTTSGVRTAFDSFQWRLRAVTTARVQNLLSDLYMDCRDSAGAPRSIDHPVLNYLLSLHSENFLNSDPELLPLSMSLANWRNGHSFWDPENEVAGKNDGKAENDDVFPRLQGRLYQSDDDKHIATPRFSMVPPQSSRIPRFSSGLQGIVATCQ